MNELTLLSKVALLLSGSLLIGAAGTYLGRAIQSIGAFILLAVLFIGGAIGVMFLASAPPAVGITSLFVWVFISGLFIGPSIEMYAKKLGWQTVFLAYAGTGGVMALTGAVGMFSGVDFSGLGPILMFGLFGLIIAGIVGIFWRMSRTVNIVYSLIGMVIFAGYFLLDFFRLTKSENTWESAIRLTMAIYLDFINFLLYLLQFLAAASDKS
ncbi:MAG: Bax inhibitor-1/YccA family protein [Candidatus Melainabacteria bacterium]|nr:Bax inhibitor-1/YccA family protein [Candidatus Melainabacteria bacterium]